MKINGGRCRWINRTLIESAISMLYHTKIPLKFLAEAINRALCLHNPSPTSALEDKTPLMTAGLRRNQTHQI